MGGLRPRNARVEQRLPDLEDWLRRGHAFNEVDFWRYLVNPSKGNSSYTYEDVQGEITLQALRRAYNHVADLQRGMKFIGLIPREPQRLGHVVDAYPGKDIATTSALYIKHIGNPFVGVGFKNESQYLPEMLTLGGRFAIGHYGIVGLRVR